MQTGNLRVNPLYAGFIDRYNGHIAPPHRVVCDRLVAGFDAYRAAAETGAQGLVHGDYRLDNLLFGIQGADRPLTVVDWQTVTWGPALTDLAYFLGCALPVPMRRAHAENLINAYHDALGPAVPLTLDDIHEGVRRQSFFGVMMAIVSSMLVQRTERGDEMFMVMLERNCEHVSRHRRVGAAAGTQPGKLCAATLATGHRRRVRARGRSGTAVE